MGRILFWLLLGAAVWWLARSWSRGHQRGAGRHSGGAQDARSESTEHLVVCRQCGVHLPKSSALLAGPGYFCCAKHRDAYQAQGQDGP